MRKRNRETESRKQISTDRQTNKQREIYRQTNNERTTD